MAEIWLDAALPFSCMERKGLAIVEHKVNNSKKGCMTQEIWHFKKAIVGKVYRLYMVAGGPNI